MIIQTKYLKIYFTAFLMLIGNAIFGQKKFVIVLDAGHGGKDNGAKKYYSEFGMLREKDLTLDITLKVGKLLEKDKDFKVIYTRKTDVYPTLTERTNLANRSKADFFVSIHVNSTSRSSAYGTETFVQGTSISRENLEVAKAENEVIFLDAQDRETFASYDPSSPESLIALKLQQSRYQEASLIMGAAVEENFVQKDKRFSRGVKQENFHVLRMNAMPSILIEIGFISNYDDAQYMVSQQGQEEITQSIYNAIMKYKRAFDKKNGINNKVVKQEPAKPVEVPLKNDFRILLMSTPTRYNEDDPALKGLKYVLPIKEGNFYKYYYSNTNFASVRDSNLKTAKDAGFRNAISIGFIPNQTLANGGHYRIEIAATKDKLSSNSYILQTLKDVTRKKENRVFYYTYGNYKTLEEAIKAQKEIEAKGIKNTIIEKVSK